MRVEHPIARQDDGVVDDYVTVNGRTVAVDDDGTFEVPDDARGWLRRWAAGYDEDPEALVVDGDDGDADTEDPETCQAVKSDGEVCGRELPCRYHSDDEGA